VLPALYALIVRDRPEDNHPLKPASDADPANDPPGE
jgi:hypothetical protein